MSEDEIKAMFHNVLNNEKFRKAIDDCQWPTVRQYVELMESLVRLGDHGDLVAEEFDRLVR